MSRHRAVKNLDFEEEFYDEGDDNVYDEMNDMSEEDTARMLVGIEAVKKAIGPGTGISDQEIKESLWYYYFDEEATVAWLKKTHKLKPKGADYEYEEQMLMNVCHRPGAQPQSMLRTSASAAAAAAATKKTPLTLSSLRTTGGSQKSTLAGLRSLGSAGAMSGLSNLSKRAQPPSVIGQAPQKREQSPSVVGQALSALRTSSAAPSNTPNSLAQPGRLLSQMGALSSMQAGRASKAPLLKNFAGRQVPTLRSSAVAVAGAGAAGEEQSPHRAILNTEGLVSKIATLYAKPSSLADFILGDVRATSAADTEAAALAAMGELKREIAGLLKANQQQQQQYVGLGDNRGDVDVDVDDGQHRMATNFLRGDVSFVSDLVGSGSKSAKKFGFDTPSPDDKVLAAQGGAGGSSSNKGAPKKQGKALPAAKEPAAPAKEISQLKIGGDVKTSSSAAAVEAAPEPTPAKARRRIDVAAEYEKTQGQRNALNLVVVGHVDAGKSTLMGHLLYALGQVNERTLRKFEREAEKIGKGSFAYAWVLDETDEERARGVTMDVATSAFETADRRFTLLDAPGHRDFVPNMISGASRADVCVLVVDASTGGFESGFDGDGQTREHAQLVRALGVRQVVVAVNKLDTVGWSADRYSEIVARLQAFMQGCGFARDDVRYVPVSGLGGVNLTQRVRDVAELAWYRDGDSDDAGPCLVELLNTFEQPERSVCGAFRLAVSDFFRGGSAGSAGSVSVSGRIAQGNVQTGDAVVVVPGGATGVVRAIDVGFEPQDWAVAGDEVVVQVQGLDMQQLAAGAVLCAPERPIAAVTCFEAQIAVFDPAVPITNGFPALVHVQSLSVPGSVRRIIETFDARTGEVTRRRPRHIRKGATARVEIATETPVCLELFKDAKDLGRIMLRRGGETVAAGIVTKLMQA
ncbi:hypothetical protein GGF43_001517 [Coemansia sp. RSA 2618]|nr:hypothetical protein GGF43_001517 [Coemansia sp. RSA 2618]